MNSMQRTEMGAMDKKKRMIVGFATAVIVAGFVAASGGVAGKDNTDKKTDPPVGTQIFMAFHCRGMVCDSSQWFEVQSFSWGANQPLDASSGQATGRVHVSEVSITKFTDGSSHDLMTDVLNGQHLQSVDFGFYPLSGGNGSAFLKVTLTDVLVSSFHFDADRGQLLPTEEYGFTFHKIEYSHTIGNTTQTDEWSPAEA